MVVEAGKPALPKFLFKQISKCTTDLASFKGGRLDFHMALQEARALLASTGMHLGRDIQT